MSEKDGPILVEHKFLCGGRAPQRVVFDDSEEFVAHLTGRARAGDEVSVWNLWPFMWDTQPLAQGKRPGAEGKAPLRGAY